MRFLESVAGPFCHVAAPEDGRTPAAAGLRETAALRLRRDAAAAGVIFSGQNFWRAQSQNVYELA